MIAQCDDCATVDKSLCSECHINKTIGNVGRTYNEIVISDFSRATALIEMQKAARERNQ